MSNTAATAAHVDYIKVDELVREGSVIVTSRYELVQCARISETLSIAVYTNGDTYGVATIKLDTYRGRQLVWDGFGADMAEAEARDLANDVYRVKRARLASV